MVSAYIWTAPDTLTEHKDTQSVSNGVTACGITWESLPDNVFTGQDGSTYVEQGDKPWYSDHDRDDVVKCAKCYQPFIPEWRKRRDLNKPKDMTGYITGR